MSEKMIMANLKGSYANYLKIGQNAFEFLLVFGHLYSEEDLEDEEAMFHTRIITTPVYAKAFAKVLKDCLERYEKIYGAIPEEIVETAMSDSRGWLL